MSFENAEIAVQGFFHEEWNGLTPIAWPDVPFTKPNGTWVRFVMQNNIGKQASIGAPGANMFRRVGVIMIQVFSKENQGASDARAKAEEAAEIFITKNLPGFEFYGVNVRPVGSDGHGWNQYNVIVEYKYDVIT